MPVHHLMVGTWTPPGAIFTIAFDDEKLTCELVKRTEIPQEEPISWMAFDVCCRCSSSARLAGPRGRAIWLTVTVLPAAQQEEHLRRRYEEVVQLRRQEPNRDCP